MADVPAKVLNWLYSVLTSEYSDVNRTYHDAAEALSNYPSLSPRTDIYTYENGSSALLLTLSGTLPVNFRGTIYAFPVAIWVPFAYPREAPFVYVTPSQDMVVRPGQHVSGDGRVYHPYLAQWAQYWDKSTLFDFLAVLRGVFAKEPPVRSKQQQSSMSTPAPQAPPPVPPPPEEWRRSVQGTPGMSPSSSVSNQPPAPPPKPPKPFEQNRPTSQASTDRYSQPPPLPPQQSQQPRQPPPPHPQYRQTQNDNYGPTPNWQQRPQSGQQSTQNPSSHFDRNQTPPGPRPPMPPVQTQGHGLRNYGIGSPVSPITPDNQRNAPRYERPLPPPQPPMNVPQPQQYQGPPGLPSPQPQQQQQYSQSQQQYQQAPQGYPPQQYSQHQQFQQPPPQPRQQQQQPPTYQAPPAPKPPPINLLDDSLEVTLPSQMGNQAPLPVPPVPPNPEKDALLRALSETLIAQTKRTVSSNLSAVTPLRAQQAALQTAYSRLQSELADLQQLDTALASNEAILKQAMMDVDRVMQDARTRKAPDVDDVLVAPTVVGGQLYALAAEEKGIADALFVLGRALDKGRVGVDVFVKQTRSLAREQFLKKALIKKIAKGMALDEYQVR